MTLRSQEKRSFSIVKDRIDSIIKRNSIFQDENEKNSFYGFFQNSFLFGITGIFKCIS
jgi:hypothetical protein